MDAPLHRDAVHALYDVSRGATRQPPDLEILRRQLNAAAPAPNDVSSRLNNRADLIRRVNEWWTLLGPTLAGTA